MGKNKKKDTRISKISTALFFFCIIAIAITMYIIYNKEEKYLVKEGTIDHVTTGPGYVIKNETLIDIDTTKVLVPTVSEGTRVTKGNIIATYRNQEYQQYQKKLRDIDESILEALKDIKIEYSSEINNIEKQVLNSVIASKGMTSMVNMQEQRVHINNLLSKKAALVGALSPEDAYVKQLIKEREQIEEQSKIATANIKATVSGLVSYTSDGLENKLNLSTIFNLNYEDIKNIVDMDKDIINNKIKITNNYEAYILVKVSGIEE
ncbi:MAG: HlyD family efflux transporter periplasmic adaptor subunit, partial [Clostridia bacterium]|nr:HlyD family efflux transporter periplasmic adaptor subunit [Clostridia bacterium]